MDVRVTLGIGSVYLLVKGLAGTLISLAVFPLLRGGGSTSVQYQEYSLLIMLPWSLKPLIAVVADWSGRSRTIVIIAATIGAAAAFGLSQSDAISVVVGLSFVCSFEIATVDILAEGEYASLLRTYPDDGSSKHRIIAAVWAAMFAGQIVGSLVSGNVPASTCILVAAPLLGQVLVAASCKWLFSDRPTAVWRPGTVMAAAMSVAAVGMVPATVYGSVALKLAYAAFVSIALLVMAWHLLPTALAMANLYMFLSSVLYLPINGAMDYFSTASHECVPGGPALPLPFFISAGSTVAAFACAFAVCLFKQFMSGWRFRTMFWLATVLRAMSAVFDVVFVLRWNLKLGISDRVMFLAGDAVVQPIASTLDTLPMALLTAELCVGGAESTTYAILAGFQNFGVTIATTFGAALQTLMGVHFVAGGPCTYAHLPHLIVLSHMALPLLAIPLAFVLIKT